MELFEEILTRKILKKAVFSKPEDRATVKTVLTPYKRPDGAPALRAERYASDNKALRDNLPYDSAETLAKMANNEFRQVNIFTTAGDIEIRRSKSGGVHIAGKLAQDAETAELSGHDKAKNYIIDPSKHAGFLTDLGLADKNGRIHDKKQAKFRQINRFLEIIRDIEDSLPTDRPIVIYDLCCGKSYLTFAVYYYFTAIRAREVDMCGVDLKKRCHRLLQFGGKASGLHRAQICLRQHKRVRASPSSRHGDLASRLRHRDGYRSVQRDTLEDRRHPLDALLSPRNVKAAREASESSGSDERRACVHSRLPAPAPEILRRGDRFA